MSKSKETRQEDKPRYKKATEARKKTRKEETKKRKERERKATYGEGKWRKQRKSNKTANPTSPQLKSIFVQIYLPAPPTGATENFHKPAHIWENRVPSAATQTKNWKSAFFQITSEQILRKFMSCPFSPRQPNAHECTPPSQKTIFFSVFFDMPTQKSPTVIKAFQKCASFSPEVQTKNSQNQQFQTNRRMPQ